MTKDLVARVVWLCRALRGRGLSVTSSHAVDAIRALQAGAVRSRDHAYLALRCVLVSRPEDFAAFDDLFWIAFAREGPERQRADGGGAPPRRRQEPRGPAHPSLSQWLQQGEDGSGDETEEVPGASDHSALVRKDFASFAEGDLEEIERIAARLARRLAARPGRRWKPAKRGARVDLRRTVRRSLSTSGEALDLRFRRRKPRKTRIVALCDVSGSMDLYSRLLLQFLYALHGSVARVESFAFSTSLLRITDSLRERPFTNALRGLSERVHDWSGGTRIGACLSTFNAEWGKLVDRRTVVVILSDGWDTGDPAELASQLELLKSRCRRLVWLNPLLGSPGYQPVTRGMEAALPHIGVFASAHDLQSLRSLEKHLLA
ncbi:MAG TPA: VWA domain-containing protein [Myxococcales bacterium]|nr:VWA domain-containing protein [Myxococcales bacterium]